MQRPNGDLNFTEDHLGNVAAGVAQNRNRLHGVKVIHAGEILGGEKMPRVISAACQHHKGDAVFDCSFQPYLGVEIVQLFQQAPIFDITQNIRVICKVILYNGVDDADNIIGKACVLVQSAETVFQRHHDPILKTRLKLPEVDRESLAAVGIGDVKHIADLVAVLAVHQEGDSVRSLVYPSTELVPGADFGAGRGFRFLIVDQELLTEVILVVVRCGLEKRHIAVRAGRDLNRLPRSHF